MKTLQYFDVIKRLVIHAIASDDTLLERLVLKGGNALTIAYGMHWRASMDVDYSIEGDFSDEERAQIPQLIETAMNTTFHKAGYALLDFKFEARPRKRTAG